MTTLVNIPVPSKCIYSTSKCVFTATYENEIPIWKKNNTSDQIDVSYKYIPEVIKPGLTWESSVKSGIYFYGDDSQQNAISFSSGPRIILGSYKKKFFESKYSNVLNLLSIFNVSRSNLEAIGKKGCKIIPIILKPSINSVSIFPVNFNKFRNQNFSEVLIF